jgi:hypothetical protein
LVAVIPKLEFTGKHDFKKKEMGTVTPIWKR